MGVVSIRGAITVEENNNEHIILNTKTLLNQLIMENNIQSEDIISILFTATEDLNEAYPAKAAREIGLVECSLLCFQEMYVKNSLEKCIRILIMLNSDKKQSQVSHIYLKGAKRLRKDLLK
ncbi:chorismate mutase [Clostridium sp. D2Q-11]|uniref:chorismate mutase n=1 Tax=Anaeromonas frigoriresistens TaxID=2683708 RepID=A0A942V4Y0_9FIRM|nr:chorismate mutase [Anaeromonas frigoriresistens]MBS4539942.1 chorismate mutase [Anaeromonas frigoriresistens]